MNSEETKPLLFKQKLKYDCLEEDEEETHPKQEVDVVDGGSAWWVVVASFFCISVLDGTMYSFGVFLGPLVEDLHQPMGVVSMVGSLQVAFSAFIAPVAGYCVNKRGARTVILAGAITASFGLLLASFSSNLVGVFGGLSFLTGTGFGLMYIPAVVAVAESFTTRRSLAVGLAVSGAGAGQVGMAPLASWVVRSWGWRVGLQMLSGITLVCALLGLFMKRKKVDNNNSLETTENTSNFSEASLHEDKKTPISVILGKKIATQELVHVFLVMVCADALAVMALYIPYSYLKPVAAMAGVTAELSAILISAIGVGSVTGRLLAGWMSDQPWCHPLFLTRAVVSVACAIPFLLSWVDHFWMFCGLAILFGFLTGQWIAATAPLLVNLLGIDQVGQAFGLLTAVRGAAALISPPMAGMLVDLTTNPLLALYLSGILLVLSGLVYSFSIWIFKRKTKVKSLYSEI